MNATQTCSVCLIPFGDNCAACKISHYCSSKCQKTDVSTRWPYNRRQQANLCSGQFMSLSAKVFPACQHALVHSTNSHYYLRQIRQSYRCSRSMQPRRTQLQFLKRLVTTLNFAILPTSLAAIASVKDTLRDQIAILQSFNRNKHSATEFINRTKQLLLWLIGLMGTTGEATSLSCLSLEI